MSQTTADNYLNNTCIVLYAVEYLFKCFWCTFSLENRIEYLLFVWDKMCLQYTIHNIIKQKNVRYKEII